MSTALRPPPGPPLRQLRITATQFNRMGDMGWFEGRRPFLLDGTIWEQGPMDPPHAMAIGLTQPVLLTVFPAGWWVRGQLPLHVDEYNDPLPDFAVVPGSPRDYHGRHPNTAALVVDVSDTTLATDTTEKAERYATAGIGDYWVLDLSNRRLIVLRDPAPIPDNGAAYRTHLTFGPADTVSPLAAPHAAVKVSDLLP